MIKPININHNSFRADTKTVNPITGEYKDPLMRWPLRGAAFTNEVGEALRPLIGEYATLSWAPALLYIGADIYDKYKNNQTEYSPDSRRCLKQAIFQGMASILLPLFAVKTGQNIFSLIGAGSKNKITINAEEQITKLAQQYVANGQMRAHRNNDDECIRSFLDILANNRDYKKQKESAKNPFKKFYLKMLDDFNINKKENIEKYAKEKVNELINIRKSLLAPDETFLKTKHYQRYKTALNSGQTKNVAIKSVLNEYLCKNTLKGKFLKTLGGFIALGLAIKPIDNFVEKTLIGKVVEPGLNRINSQEYQTAKK